MARYSKDSTPKLTKELIEEISLHLRMGSYVETAAATCGISKDTFYRWLRQGKRDEKNTLPKQLSYAVERSISEAEMRDIDVINKAAFGSPKKFLVDQNGEFVFDPKGRLIVIEEEIKPDWKASAWRLERRCPKRWGRRSEGIIDLLLQDDGGESAQNLSLEEIDVKIRFIDAQLKQLEG